MADASERIREHRERKKRSEIAAKNAPVPLAERRQFLDSADTITAFAEDLSEFPNESDMAKRRAVIRSFVREIVVMPGNAVVLYTVPMPDDSCIRGRNAEEMALNGSFLSTVKNGTPNGIRTRDLRLERAVSLAARRWGRTKTGRLKIDRRMKTHARFSCNRGVGLCPCESGAGQRKSCNPLLWWPLYDFERPS